MCLPPLNVSYTIEQVSGTSNLCNFTYNGNGEMEFEYTVVTLGQSPSTGNIHELDGGYPSMWLNNNIDYDFYIRGVCKDGGKTSWTKKSVIFN